MKLMKTVNKVMAMALLVLTLLGLSTQAAIAKDDPANLFVMTAPTVELQSMMKANHLDEYQLTLMGMKPSVTYFTEKPHRVTGTTSIETFMNIWKMNELNKTENQPNVSLVSYTNTSKEPIIYVFELKDPRFDAKTGAVQFTAKALGENTPSVGTVQTMHQASLFIDDIHWHGNKFKPPHD